MFVYIEDAKKSQPTQLSLVILPYLNFTHIIMGFCANFWMLHSTEHFGWLLCYVFSAVWGAYLLMVYNSQILQIAELAADESGNLPQFFGMRWSNAITLPASVGAFSMLILGPLIGSLADYTSYRKLFGGIAVVVTIVCNALHIFISNSFIGVILGFSVLMQISYLSVYMLYRAPYLPELGIGEEVTKLSAKGYLILFVSQMFFMGFLWSLGTAIAKDDPYIYMRSTSAVAVIIGSIVGLVVIKNMGYREASSKLQKDESLLTVGFKSVFVAFKDMSINYTQLKRFLFFSSFANASFNASLSLGITYLVGIGMTTNQINGALSSGVVSSLLGPLTVTALMNRKFSVRKITLCTMTLYFCVIVLIPILVPLHYSALLVLMSGLGIAQGMWLSAGQAFFAALCPGGKEATFTGCYMFGNKFFDWMPPLIFSLVNQYTGNISTAYYASMIVFIALGTYACYTIDMQKGATEIQETLASRRMTLSDNEEEAVDISVVPGEKAESIQKGEEELSL